MAAEAQKPKIPHHIPSVLDREIDSLEKDAFGHRHFAEALKGLVESSDHTPPFSIGLLGGWGTGKSSVKALYLRELSNTTGKGARSERIHTVTFNAWRFGGGDIRRALLRDVFVQLGGDESEIHRHFFSQTSQAEKLPRGFKALFAEFYDRFFFNLAQILVYLAVAVLASNWGAKYLGVSNEDNVKWVLGIFAAFMAFAPKFIEKLTFSRYTDVTRVELPKATAEQYEKLLTDQIKTYKDRRKNVERIVVFVDDLDRLSSEEMVGGLDAIRTLMELPVRADGIGIVFVISCDEDLVAEALYKRSPVDPDIPGAISSRQDARRYLDRIFQFRLDILPMPRMDMRGFAKDLLGREAFSQVADAVVAGGSSIDEIVGTMIHVGVKNPRNAIQIINAFGSSMWLAMTREFEGKAAAQPGALAEGVVTKHPLSLAVLSVLRIDFPEFFKMLQAEPGVLQGFLDVFVRSGDPGALAGTVRTALSSLASDQTQETWKVKEKHGALRQFLSSVQFIRFPSSLQLLILLSQDEVSRKTNDAGSRLFDPVVSGDVSGTLQTLGRDSDERPLTSQEVEALATVWDALADDSEDRRGRAAFTLASMIGRAPETEARRLAVPLAPTLLGNAAIRGRLGIGGLAGLLPHLKGSDTERLLSQLASDYGLSEGHEISALSSTGSVIDLDTSVDLVPEVVELLIKEWEAGRLPANAKRGLASWLVDRTISVGGNAKSLEFRRLDEWVTQHEATLLSEVGIGYARGAIAELPKKTPSLLDKAKARDRVVRVLDTLGGGSDEFWEIAGAMAALGDVDACMAVQPLIEKSLGIASAEQFGSAISILAERVTRYAGEEALHKDDADAVRIMKAACLQRPADIASAAGEIAAASIKLSAVEASSDEAVSLTEALRLPSSDEWQKVMSDWASRVATDLPAKCVEYLGSKVNLIEDPDALTDLTTGLNAGLTDATGALAQTINAFWSAAQGAGTLATPHLQSAAQAALADMSNSYANFGAKRPLWPTYRRAIRSLPAAAVDGHLSSLATNCAPTPISHAAFIEFMADQWKDSANYPSLNLHTCATHADSSIRALGSAAAGGTILTNLRPLIEAGDLTDAEKDGLLGAASLVWSDHPDGATQVIEQLGHRVWIEELKPVAQQWQTRPVELAPYGTRVINAATEDIGEEDATTLIGALLELDPIRSDESNDIVIQEFVNSLNPDVARKLLDFGRNVENNVTARKRVIERLAPLASDASADWLADFIESAASVSADNLAETAIEAFRGGKSASTLSSAATAVLASMSKSASLDAKRLMAKLSGELSGKAPAEQFIKGKEISEIDLQILADTFPLSQNIKSKLRRMTKNAKAGKDKYSKGS